MLLSVLQTLANTCKHLQTLEIIALCANTYKYLQTLARLATVAITFKQLQSHANLWKVLQTFAKLCQRHIKGCGCCHRDKCLPDKCNHNSWHLAKTVPGTYLQSLFNIGSVTADIFLIWTNVCMKNLAWTNVNKIVGICYMCSQEATFIVSSKSGP